MYTVKYIGLSIDLSDVKSVTDLQLPLKFEHEPELIKREKDIAVENVSMVVPEKG